MHPVQPPSLPPVPYRQPQPTPPLPPSIHSSGDLYAISFLSVPRPPFANDRIEYHAMTMTHKSVFVWTIVINDLSKTA